MTTGCTWPRVAEIGLVGALGCGTPLVGALLAWLRSGAVVNPQDGRPYDFVVLQAARGAIAFYERLGFERVLAEGRHFTEWEAVPGGGGWEPRRIGPWRPYVHYEYVASTVQGQAIAPSVMMALRVLHLSTLATSTAEIQHG